MRITPIFFHVPKCAGTYFSQAFFIPSLICLNDMQPKIVLVTKGQLTLFQLILRGEGEEFQHGTIKIDERDLESFFEKQKVTQVVGAIIQSRVNFLETRCLIDKLCNQLGSRTESFTILRHPIFRAESLFYYLRDMGVWEERFKTLKSLTFSQFVMTKECESNWVVKKFSSLKDTAHVTHEDLARARAVMSEFSLVGTIENFNRFLEAVERKYGIKNNPGNWPLGNTEAIKNKNIISEKDPISEEVLKKFYELNKFDLELYDHFSNL